MSLDVALQVLSEREGVDFQSLKHIFQQNSNMFYPLLFLVLVGDSPAVCIALLCMAWLWGLFFACLCLRLGCFPTHFSV